jgi:MFS transporter, DHA1 family, multidrug resistance protein
MALGDFAQMLVCWQLIRAGHARSVPDVAPPASAARRRATLPVLQLGLLMLTFDFSAYLVRPFFSVHWEHLSATGSLASGLVFAIPGVVALFALMLNRRARSRGAEPADWLPGQLALGAAGLMLQAFSSEVLVVLGRCLYGWALFQVAVKLEVSLFRISTPDAYASHFGIANFCQNLGVLLSSFAAGALVDRFGIGPTFVIAAGGFLLTALLDRLTLRVNHLSRPQSPPPLPLGAVQHAP